MSKKLRYLMMIFLLLVLVMALVACGPPTPTPAPTPTETPCPDPDPTPTPGEAPPPPVVIDPIPENPTPEDPTPEDPTETPELPNPTPTEPPPTNTPPPTVNPLGTPFRDPEPPYEPVLPSRIKSFDQHLHDDGPGIDMVPETRRGGGDAARDFYVISLRDGKATNNQNENHGIDYGIGPNMIAISPLGSNEYEIMYSHVVPVRSLNGALGVPVTAGTVIGTIMDVTQDNYAAVYSDDDHLHLGYREPVSGNYKDPADYDLISAWGPEGFDR